MYNQFWGYLGSDYDNGNPVNAAYGSGGGWQSEHFLCNLNGQCGGVYWSRSV